MSSVTVPKGSIVCLMCRGAIPFENRGSYWFKKHLQKNHEIHFNYELYLAINLVNIESIKSVIRDFKQSGKLSEFTSREDDSKEVFDVEDDGATEEGTSMQVSYTSATHQMKEEEEDPKAKLYDCRVCGEKYTYRHDMSRCEHPSFKARIEEEARAKKEQELRAKREEELKAKKEKENVCKRCGEKYSLLQDMIRCVNKHEYEDELREAQMKAEKERKREEKRKNRKRKIEALVSDQEPVALDPLAKRTIVNESEHDSSVSYSSLMDNSNHVDREDSQQSGDKGDILERIDSLTSETIQAKGNSDAKVSGSTSECDQCGQKFKLKMALNRHKKSAHPIACEDCGEIFKTEELREIHRESAHAQPQMSAIEMDPPPEDEENSLSNALTLALVPHDENPTLDENLPQESALDDSEGNQSLESAGNKSYEEIVQESEYFISKPKQARKVSVIEDGKFTDELQGFPKGWFFRMSGIESGRSDKEFLYAPESVIFRSKKAAVEYAKCLYGPDIVNNL